MESLATETVYRMPREFDVFASPQKPSTELLSHRLFPPIPLWNGRPVWGFGIIDDARAMHLPDLPVVHLLGSADNAVCTALELEDRTGAYSLEEKRAIVDLLNAFHVESPSSRLESLVQPTGSFVEQARRYAALSEERRALVAGGRLNVRTAVRLTRLPAKVWLSIAARTELTASETRLLATDLEEISRRDELDEPGCIDLASKVLSAPDPVAAARSLRYPTLTKMTRQFDALADRAAGGTGVRLEAPQHFEGEAFRVSFDFASCDELEKRIEAVGRIRQVCSGLFDLL